MIRDAMKDVVKGTFATGPAWRIVGPLLRRPGVIVLMYHRIADGRAYNEGIPVEQFRAHMRWIKTNCNPIAPAQLLDLTTMGRSARPPVLVTFDDGYRDYYDVAYPVLRELQIPSLVFIATGPIDSGRMLWTDEVRWAVSNTTAESTSTYWKDSPEPLEIPLDPASRRTLGNSICDALRQCAGERRVAALDRLHDELGRPPVGRPMVSWEEVRACMPLTTFGGHTHSHPILSKITDEEAEREVRQCRERIIEETGEAQPYFAYPNGRRADFTEATKRILRANGYDTAFTTIEGIAGPDTDRMAIKRVPALSALRDFVWMAAGQGLTQT